MKNIGRIVLLPDAMRGFYRGFQSGRQAFGRARNVRFSSTASTEQASQTIKAGSGKRFGRIALTAVAGAGLIGAFFLPPGTLEATKRFARSAWAGVGIVAEYKKYEKQAIGLSQAEADRLKHIAHERAAVKLLKLFKEQGGVYVKAGQHIASLYYLLPLEYCNAMKELHNQASTQPFSNIVKVFHEDLGAHPNEIFDSFDEVPIAAASIAQVHKAVYKGKKVAVKVQFPTVSSEANADVFTIDSITKLVEKIFPEFKFGWLVREFEENLPHELNFEHEAENANRIRASFANDPFCTTPKIYKATKRLLIMEFIDGVPINQAQKLREMGINTRGIVHNLNRVMNHQIFNLRFTHCDPHPGNVLVRVKNGRPQIVLLDNGLYREYDEDFGMKYAELWMSILQQDEAKIASASKALGVGDFELFASMLTARSYQSLRNNMYQSVESEEINYIQEQAARRASDITSILATVPSPLLLLLKTNDLLRIVNQDLGSSPHHVFATTMAACQQLLHKKLLSEKPGWRSTFVVGWERFTLKLKLALFDWYIMFITAFGSPLANRGML